MNNEDIELAIAEILASLAVDGYHMSFNGLGFSGALYKEPMTLSRMQPGVVLWASGHENSKKTWSKSHKFRGASIEDVIRQFVVWASKCQT